MQKLKCKKDTRYHCGGSPQSLLEAYGPRLLGDDSEVSYLFYCIYLYMVSFIVLYFCLSCPCLYSVVLVQ
jgi:hypothetical protein